MKVSSKKNHDFDLISPGIDNLSFESVQSMPPVKISKNNNNVKQKGILNAKKFDAMSKLNKGLVYELNESDDNDVFSTNWTNSNNLFDNNVSSRHCNSASSLSVSTPNIFKSIEKFSTSVKNIKNSVLKSIDLKTCIDESLIKSTPKRKASFKMPTPILKNTNIKQRKVVELPDTPVTKSEQNFLRRSPRIKLLESKLSKKF